MRRYLVWVGVALVVAAGLWTAGWFWVRGAALDRLAEAEERLDAQGRTLTYAEARVAGFPLDHRMVLEDVALTDRESGALLRLSLITAQAVNGGDLVAASLPDRFSLRVPVSESRRALDPVLPEALDLQISGASLVLVTDRAGRMGTLSGKALEVVLEMEGVPYRYALAITGPDIEGRDQGMIRLSADAFEATIRGQADAGPSVSALIRAAASTVELAWPGEVGKREVIFGAADGRVALDYQLGALAMIAEVRDDPLGMNGRYDARAAQAGGTAEVTGGRLDLALGADGVAWEFTGSELSPDGAVAAARTAVEISMPLVPSTIPVPGAVEVRLEEITADEGLWRTVDPDGVLPRDPARVEIETDLTLRLMGRIDRLPSGLAPPYEISNIMIERIALEAVGASARASGDIEIIQPILVPTGMIAVEASGVEALAGRLAQIGVIDAGMLTTFQAILQVYASPGDGVDVWQTEVRTGIDGVTVNGQPLQ